MKRNPFFIVNTRMSGQLQIMHFKGTEYGMFVVMAIIVMQHRLASSFHLKKMILVTLLPCFTCCFMWTGMYGKEHHSLLQILHQMSTCFPQHIVIVFPKWHHILKVTIC